MFDLNQLNDVLSMNRFFIIWALAIVVGSLISILAIWRGSNYPRLIAGGLPESLPLISVILPVRNEIRNIRRCVLSLLEQDYPNYEIIVVDGESTDGTREWLAKHELNPRLTVIDEPPLPRNWVGKTWANHCGVQAAKGDALLFIDGDTWHHSKLMSAALRYLLDEDLDMLSIIGDMEVKSTWEKIVMPLIFFLIAVSTGGTKVNDPKSKDALANGQFIMIRRDAYTRFGGHEAIKGALTDDVELWRLVKQKGGSLQLVMAQGLFSTRMYQSWNEIVDGFSRAFFPFAGQSVVKAWIAIASVLFTFIVPFLVMVGALSLIISHSLTGTLVPAHWVAFYLSVAGYIPTIGIDMVMRTRSFRISPLWSMLQPLAAAVVTYIMENSIRWYRHGEPVWKGRVLPRGSAGDTRFLIRNITTTDIVSVAAASLFLLIIFSYYILIFVSLFRYYPPV